MKSLAEREAFREQQKRDNDKRERENGYKPQAHAGDEDNKSGNSGNGGFDSKKYLGQNAKAVADGLGKLSDDDLAAVAEGNDTRQGVQAAVKAEQDKRTAAKSGWTGNNS